MNAGADIGRRTALCATIVPCPPTTWKISDAAPPRPTAPLSNASSNPRGLARASAAQADLVILNTCTVTNSADQDARAAIRRVQRQNPLAKIIVTGCYAQRAPAGNCSAARRYRVIGNSHKHQLAEIVLDEIQLRGSTAGFLSLSDSY